ncbi:MAG: response regulator, partial [Alphaproteobacteria bacterium]|nr:response regulator [Alphaproteobacteria bacterium]
LIGKGESIFQPEVDDAWMQSVAVGQAHLDFMRGSELRSAMIVPMRMDQVPLGAITLWHTGAGARRHAPSDRELAGDLSRIAGLAVARARQHAALARLNAALESEVEARTRERDRIWHVSDELMSVAGRDGYLKAVNPAWLRTLGHDEATLLSTPFREFTHVDDQTEGSEIMRRLARGESVARYESRMRRADGGWRWISWTVVPADGNYYAIGRDVTEQRAAADELAAANRRLLAEMEEREKVEATLRQMQRLEAVGQLTSGVAHDFNNLLTVLLGNIAFLEKSDAAADAKTARRFANMRTAAERGARLTAQLLAFSRRQHLEPATIDLNAAVAHMGDLLQTTLGPSVRLATELDAGLWPALVDPTQIELAILNLALNARDAMAGGGTVLIRTSNHTLDGKVSFADLAAGDYVGVTVEDTGTGMDENVLARAFEPFFTTKEPGRGSGLGLSQVFGFAQQSGGSVAIESLPGEGTRVTVLVPRGHHRKLHEDAPDGSEKVGMAAVRARILLVDDEALVREVIAAELRALGHEVVEAGSGGAAMEAIESCDVDLTMLDFAMPGMNGVELARQLRNRKPALSILFITGYADADALPEVADDCILEKPLRPDDLARKLKSALERAA